MSEKGFTLLEVLIALVLLAVSFSAVFYSLTVTTHQLISLQDKTAAQWVGMNIIAKVQLGLIESKGGESGIEPMFSSNWRWQLTVNSTENPLITILRVGVSKENSTGTQVQLTGYLLSW